MKPTLLTKSPCIGVCENNKREICKGCGRSRLEIDNWKNLSSEQRHEINPRVLVTQGKKVREKILKEFAELAEKRDLSEVCFLETGLLKNAGGPPRKKTAYRR